MHCAVGGQGKSGKGKGKASQCRKSGQGKSGKGKGKAGKVRKVDKVNLVKVKVKLAN